MFNLNFKDRYRVVHVNNELGNCVIGGAGTFMNELYKHRGAETGFVYMNLGASLDDFNLSDFMEGRDILVMNWEEAYKLEHISCDVLVIQFYELAPFITDAVRKDKKLVYIIHSVPTPEPPPEEDPFGGNDDIRKNFERLCEISDMLVCVSEAEKKKLSTIYPEYADKITVVYNGISSAGAQHQNKNYLRGRKRFGYIGRLDYRKGILECIREIRDTEAELHIACPKNDYDYMEKILNFIEGAGMENRVKFYGWCVGERKENFLDSLDALVIPSLYEPFGYVALEAMERGLMVISSNNGGLDEILEGYRYKYDPYAPGGLRRQILTFMSDDNDTIEQQQKLLGKNLERFSTQIMLQEYEKVLRN